MNRSFRLLVTSLLVFIFLGGNISFAQSKFEEITIINIEDEAYQIMGDNLAYIESEILEKDFNAGLTKVESKFYDAGHNPDMISEQELAPSASTSTAYYVLDYKTQYLAKATDHPKGNSQRPTPKLTPTLGYSGLGFSIGSSYYSGYRGYNPFRTGYNSYYGSPYYSNSYYASSYYCPTPVYYYVPNAGEYVPVISPSPVIVAYDEEQTLPASSISFYAEESNNIRKNNAFIDKGGNKGIIGASEGGRSHPDIVKVKSVQLGSTVESTKNKAELLNIIRKTDYNSYGNNASLLRPTTRSRTGKPSIFSTYNQRSQSRQYFNTNRSNTNIYSSPARQKTGTSFNNRSTFKSSSSSSSRGMTRPAYSAPRTTPKKMATPKSGKNKN